jgi:hypothetical protein
LQLNKDVLDVFLFFKTLESSKNLRVDANKLSILDKAVLINKVASSGVSQLKKIRLVDNENEEQVIRRR